MLHNRLYISKVGLDLKTEILKLDKNNIEADKLGYAAEVLKGGGLVAFPTETVYGLGANALDERAVKSIFTAKGRPSDNPLIVHIADMSEIKRLTSSIPIDVPNLMERFWPGPLTLVFKKSDIVPSIITAGLDTVAVRMPLHPIALALIKESGLPIAAPSANTSGKPSPTTAKHVIDDLLGRVHVIIDGGEADVGLESTVLDLTAQPRVVLRPGGVTPDQLKEVLGEVIIDPALVCSEMQDITPRSPGMKYTHYSPKAEVLVVEGELSAVVKKIQDLIGVNKDKGLSVGVLATAQTRENYRDVEIISMGSRENPDIIAANLFRALRDFDETNVDIILAEAIDNSGIGLAVMNRLNKAAGHNVIKA